MDKTLELRDLGLTMKKAAEKTRRNTIKVDKKLWIEVADLLIDTDNNLQMILAEIEEISKMEERGYGRNMCTAHSNAS